MVRVYEPQCRVGRHALREASDILSELRTPTLGSVEDRQPIGTMGQRCTPNQKSLLLPSSDWEPHVR